MSALGWAQRVEEATRRGVERGFDDGHAGAYRNTSPLSGEWAGESINEILGDLLVGLAVSMPDDEQWLCDAYENGYNVGYDEGRKALDRDDADCQCADCRLECDHWAEEAPQFRLCFDCATARANDEPEAH